MCIRDRDPTPTPSTCEPHQPPLSRPAVRCPYWVGMDQGRPHQRTRDRLLAAPTGPAQAPGTLQ
eukprot:11840363-Alexandrium_andersonii.AAC.1